jgi:hypothetical protein
MKFTENPHLSTLEGLNSRRKLLQMSELGATLTSRAQILALAKLNFLAYPGDRDEIINGYYGPEIVDPIYKAGDGAFGSNLTSELDKIEAMHKVIEAEVNQTAGASWAYKNTPNTARKTIGVAALEFTRGNLTLLVFRGTFTPGDYNNINNWIIEWVLGSMTAHMKRVWTDQAGLDWGPDLQDKAQQSTFKQTMVINAVVAAMSPFLSSAFPSDLAAAVAGLANLSFSAADAARLGYWPLDKLIADSARAAAAARGGELRLSGHSQGGTRAQLVSMYLRKRYGETYPGITFGATGAMCLARRLGSGADLLGALPRKRGRGRGREGDG